MFNQKMFLLLSAFVIYISAAEAQRSANSGRYQSGNRSRLGTSYFSGNNRGPLGYGNFNNFGNIGYGGLSPYQINPYLNYRVPVVTPALPPVTGTVEKYSDVEYGEIVQMAIAAARQNNPGGATPTVRKSIVDKTTATTTGQAAYQPVATGVSDIIDRGIIILPTGEELRLRGVSIPSITDSNEVSRLYAREAVRVLKNLTQGKEVYVVLDEPLRDSTGHLLGTLILADGTELNRRMLELGYGSVKAEDFGVGVDYSDLAASQESARANRLGIWSKGY